MPGLAQASLRSGFPMPNRHSQKKGELLSQQFQFFSIIFPQKCQRRLWHRGYNAALKWPVMGMGRFRATKILQALSGAFRIVLNPWNHTLGLSASSCHVTGIDLRDPRTEQTETCVIPIHQHWLYKDKMLHWSFHSIPAEWFSEFLPKKKKGQNIKPHRLRCKDFRSTWNPKQPFINGCFNRMIPNLYIGNGCFTKHPL